VFLLRRALSLIALVALVSLLVAADPPKPEKPTKEQIAKWIQQLGDNDFEKREEAQQKLWEAGQAAEAALREATKDSDKEISRRAQDVLDKFKWGLYPDTPKKIVDLVTKYQTGDRNAKIATVKELYEMGSAGCAVLLKIAHAEDNAEIRAALYDEISRQAGQALPLLLVEDKDATVVETLLELAVASETEASIHNYVAYFYLKGKLDDRIKHYQARVGDKTGASRDAEVLFYLLRAKGDIPAAREVAKKAGREDLIDGLLHDRGEWKELAGRQKTGESLGDIERMSYRAAYHRMAGNHKECDEALKDIRKFAEDKPAGDSERWYAAKALFLNERPAEALELLGKGTSNPAVAFEVLTAQQKFREVLELAEKLREGGNSDPVVQILEARLRHGLGEKEKAEEMFRKLAEQVKETPAPWAEKLIETEMRLGLRELAFEHAAKALGLTPDTGSQRQVLARLFPSQEATADPWWILLRRKDPKADPKATMRTLRSIMAGKLDAKELASLLQAMEAAAKDPMPKENEPPFNAWQWLQAAAEAALLARDEATAFGLFDKAIAAGPQAPQPLQRKGDLLAARKEWEKAAEAYEQVWARNRNEPLPLFLRGWALAKAGKEAEGKKLMEQSHWVLLGDDYTRAQFAKTLAQRGHFAAARREREILLHTCTPGTFHAGEVQRQMAVEAVSRKDYLQGAALHEHAMLRCLRMNVNFIESAAYVGVPGFIERLKARGYVQAGKLTEAREAIDTCQKLLPGNIDLAVHVVPELEKQGQKKDADNLFDRSFAFQAGLCKDFPNSSWCHNSLAWLCACCKRDLARAQESAEKAVKLAPEHAGYRDTLAEVLFQRGQKEQALEQMKKCVELEPQRVYFKKQLQRIQAGDPKAPLPSEDEEEDQ
jgi:predicted Zn-dependent protease